jgi:uncharacterized RDD family membrane protein YckC/TM2 domain-containing membrane protein YozV
MKKKYIKKNSKLIDKIYVKKTDIKSLPTAVIIAFFLGILGGHRFYLGKYVTGIIQMLTMGGFFIWWIYDLITLGQEKFTDSQNNKLKWEYKNGDRAGFSIRLISYFLDIIIVGFIFDILVMSTTEYLLYESSNIYPEQFQIVRFVVLMIYFVLFNYFYNATPGKILMNIQILAEEGTKITFIQSLVRYISYTFSYIMLIGFIMIGIRKDKRALHDLIAETKVIFSKPLYRAKND